VIARRAVVRGRVQGVGYRFFAERVARALGVAGWVRNLPDGTVETVAEGEEKIVDEYLARLREGPALSRVDGVDVEGVAEERLTQFEVRR
jgi:acylphosphatase